MPHLIQWMEQLEDKGNGRLEGHDASRDTPDISSTLRPPNTE